MASAPLDPTLHSNTSRSPEHHAGHSDTRRPDDGSEPSLGSPSHPRGTEEVGDPVVGADRIATPATTPSSAIANVAHLPHESRGVPGVDGLLHRADTHRPRAVRARATQPLPPPRRSPGGHRTS